MSLCYLLDTSVFSQPIRKQPHPAAMGRWATLGHEALAVATPVLAEIEFGLHRKRSEKLWLAYTALLATRLVCLDFDRESASHFARLKAQAYGNGQIVEDFDLMIASIALRHGLTVATLNARHFALIPNLQWEDWGQ